MGSGLKARGKEALHDHRYWTRIWTVQEVRHARKAIIYAKGLERTPLDVYRATLPFPSHNVMHTESPLRQSQRTEISKDIFYFVRKKASVAHDLAFALIAVYPELLGSLVVNYQ